MQLIHRPSVPPRVHRRGFCSPRRSVPTNGALHLCAVPLSSVFTPYRCSPASPLHTHTHSYLLSVITKKTSHQLYANWGVIQQCTTPWWLRRKEPACNVGDPGSIPGSGRSPGGGNGNPFQCSCLEHSMDRGAWRATVHGVAERQTWLSDKHHLPTLCATASHSVTR